MEENVVFKNSKGDNLSGVFRIVNNDINTHVVVFGHGFTSNKNGSAKDLSIKLGTLGINAFRFDFYGHGESEGKFENITVSEGVDDMIQAINYVKSRGFTKVSLFGTSFGGLCSIIAASRVQNLTLLALRAPMPDFYIRDLMKKSKQDLADWKRKGYRIYKRRDGSELNLNYSFFEDSKSNSAFIAGEKIDIPTFIVVGDHDESIPVILSEMLAKSIPNSELRIIEGGDHSFTNENHDKEAIDILFQFIQNHLH